MTASLPKLLIVDGFNVLRCGAYYAVCEGHPDFDGEALNSGREALIDDVALFAGHDYQAVVVFDGAGNVLSAGESQQVGQVEVIFSPAGTAADTVIEMRVKQAVGAGQKALVVTSDAATQWTVLGSAVTRMSAAGFCREVANLHAEQQAPPQIKAKYTLAERLDPQKLADLRRRFG